MKRIAFLGCALAGALLCLAACGGGGGLLGTKQRDAVASQELQFQTPADGAPIVTIVTDLGTVKAVLYPQYAPMAVANFTGLAQQGYFNGLSFHRIIEGFVVQSGDATGTGTGGTTIWNGTTFPVEITDKLHNYSGALGMAHTDGDTNSNASQFYIVQTAQDSVDKSAAQTLESLGVRADVISAYRAAGGAPYLDNLYTVFGQVYSGMDVVDAIGAVKCDESGTPENPVLIQSVTVGAYSAAAEAASGASAPAAASASAPASPAASAAASSGSAAQSAA